jgi:hypothetical protein
MEFYPERFHQEQVPELARFGLGARRCPGQYYGDLFTKTIIAELVKVAKVECNSFKAHNSSALITPEVCVRFTPL